MPIHGEYRMLKKHAKLAIDCGLNEEDTLVLDNGDVLELDKGKVKQIGSIEVSETYVDGNRIGDVSTAVLNDRKIMANDGILVIIANVNMDSKKLLARPMITTRGFILINENEELIKEIEDFSNNILIKKLKDKKSTYTDIKLYLTKEVASFIKEKTGRKPIVLPIILNIKKEIRKRVKKEETV